jgi:hypothetical protein
MMYHRDWAVSECDRGEGAHVEVLWGNESVELQRAVLEGAWWCSAETTWHMPRAAAAAVRENMEAGLKWLHSVQPYLSSTEA